MANILSCAQVMEQVLVNIASGLTKTLCRVKIDDSCCLCYQEVYDKFVFPQPRPSFQKPKGNAAREADAVEKQFL